MLSNVFWLKIEMLAAIFISSKNDWKTFDFNRENVRFQVSLCISWPKQTIKMFEKQGKKLSHAVRILLCLHKMHVIIHINKSKHYILWNSLKSRFFHCNPHKFHINISSEVSAEAIFFRCCSYSEDLSNLKYESQKSYSSSILSRS